MKIAAFDLGAHFAIAVNWPVLQWHSWHFQGDRQQRLLSIMNVCDEAFKLRRPDAVFYERPFGRGMAATRSGWGIAGVIEAVAAKHRLVALDMPPSTIKKFITGNGRACKEDMIAAARTFGYTGNDEHEADAICALKYAEANMEKETPNGR